ncbi:twin-arginine translocation signal domain-containing protein, partial [Citrobacter sp. AAK_AS5]
ASRRHFLVGAACAAAAGVAQARMPPQKQRPIAHERFEKWVPNQVGPWHFLTASGVVLPPPDALSDRLYDNLVTRIYDSAERPA